MIAKQRTPVPQTTPYLPNYVLFENVRLFVMPPNPKAVYEVPDNTY
ncbi:MAG: hypothetical protein KAT90_10105 [Gammaproteobacteria bacterium]|nr:hypothetical protein [Gammaproteobacteria bacterium]